MKAVQATPPCPGRRLSGAGTLKTGTILILVLELSIYLNTDHYRFWSTLLVLDSLGILLNGAIHYLLIRDMLTIRCLIDSAMSQEGHLKFSSGEKISCRML